MANQELKKALHVIFPHYVPTSLTFNRAIKLFDTYYKNISTEFNKAAVERLEQSHCAKIGQLFWIAGSLDNSDLKDMLEIFDPANWKQTFPEIYASKDFRKYLKDEEYYQALIDHEKFGFLAEVYIPKSHDFKFKKGQKKPWAWSVHSGICSIEYIYAETTEILLDKIEKIAEKCWERDLKFHGPRQQYVNKKRKK